MNRSRSGRSADGWELVLRRSPRRLVAPLLDYYRLPQQRALLRRGSRDSAVLAFRMVRRVRMVCGWMMGGWLVRWSKGDRWGAALTLVLAATACGGTVVESTDDTASAGSTGGADVPPDCVGAYAGNFDGDLRGRLTGNLHPDADFEVTFVQAGTNQGFTGS